MIEFRNAVPNDFPHVAELKRQLHSDHVRNAPDFYRDVEQHLTVEEYNAYLGPNEKRSAYVLLDGSRIVAYAFTQVLELQNHSLIYDQKQLFLDDLCIDEALRGRGYGKRLMQEIVRIAEESGCKTVELNVWDWNRSAVAFYKALGMDFTRSRMKRDLRPPTAVRVPPSIG